MDIITMLEEEVEKLKKEKDKCYEILKKEFNADNEFNAIYSVGALNEAIKILSILKGEETWICQ